MTARPHPPAPRRKIVLPEALAKVDAIPHAAGIGPDAPAEVTSRHVGPREIPGTPPPAPTAVEVAGLRRPGAAIELRLAVRAPEPA
ncbi:MAG: hypothetical protein ACU0BS_05570 [Hasllibacter sp.]